MTEEEHLLVCLMEEAAEVQHAAAKALRFGLHDGYPKTSTTNMQDIATELNDLMAVAAMLSDRGVVEFPKDAMEHIEEKQERVTAYIAYAKNLGTITN